MPTDANRNELALQKALRDLIALSAVPSLWVGREPQAIAADLVDLLAGLLKLSDYAELLKMDPTAQKVTSEMQAGLRAYQGG